MVEKDREYTIEEFTAGDGYCWHYRFYKARNPPRAQVVCIHGIQSHGGWYEYSCKWLCQAGYSVYFLDRRGSGLNDCDRGDAPGFRRLIDDLAEFLQALRQGQVGGAEVQGSGIPSKAAPKLIFLMAVSWGGKLGTALQRRWPGLVDGLVLLCPGFFSRVRLSWKERVAIFIARLVNPRKLFPIPLNDPQLFTATPRWQDFIRKDPISLRQATARLLVESVRLDGYLRFVPAQVTVPVLLLLAQKDQIIANEPTRRFVNRFASTDKKIIEYQGAHHTLEFDPDPDLHLRDLLAWLERLMGCGT